MASQLKIDIIAGIDKLSASLKDVESKFGALGDKLKNVGGTLSVAVTAPLVAIGAVATNEAQCFADQHLAGWLGG